MELIIIFSAVFYFLPWFVSLLRRHEQVSAIFVLNLFLGWTFIGWVAALVWSMTRTNHSPPYVSRLAFGLAIIAGYIYFLQHTGPWP